MNGFILRMMRMRFPWNLWIMLLGGVNVVGVVLFFNTFEGKFALIAMIGSMIVMQVIYSKYGFVRLLGLGHILFWVPFVTWNFVQLSKTTSINDNFRVWLISVTVFNSLSLLLDFADVVRFLRGEKAEMT